jgi:hypothetical protein
MARHEEMVLAQFGNSRRFSWSVAALVLRLASSLERRWHVEIWRVRKILNALSILGFANRLSSRDSKAALMREMKQ